MKNILLTGGTGFIGSFMAYKLLQEGYQIAFLARSKKGKTAFNRIQDALSFVGPISEYRSQYIVVEADITDKVDKILGEFFQSSFNEIDEVWHIAASISFKKEKAEETYQTNVEGTKHIIELTERLKVKRFHYFSTAYVCGYWKGRFFEDDLECGQKLRNPYEETKFKAEKMVRSSDFDKSIYRLGIVVGDSQTGRASVFSGYYTFARMFYVLKNNIIQNIEKNAEYFNNGFLIDEDGFLVLPVQVPCFPESTVNIVPVDYAVNSIYSVANNLQSVGKTFHIVNPRPPTVDWIFRTGMEALGIKGYRLVNLNNGYSVAKSIQEVGSKQLLYNMEMSIRGNCGVYLPYISSEPVFDDFNTRLLSGVRFPPITEEFIKKIMGYAVKTNFGRIAESIPAEKIPVEISAVAAAFAL